MKLLTVLVTELKVGDVLLAASWNDSRSWGSMYETVLEVTSSIGHREVVTGLPVIHRGEVVVVTRFRYEWPYSHTWPSMSTLEIARSVSVPLLPRGRDLLPSTARAARRRQLCSTPSVDEVVRDLMAMAERLRP